MPTDTKNETEFLVADHPIRYGTEDIQPGKTFGCDLDDVGQLIDSGAAHRATDDNPDDNPDEDTKEHQTGKNSQTDETDSDTNQTGEKSQTDSNDQDQDKTPGQDSQGDNVVNLFGSRPELPGQVDAAIKAVIIGLNKDESALWTKDKKPDANAIAEKLGWKITAAERDMAWKDMQKGR